MADYAVMPIADYEDACDAIREKTGSTELILSGDMAHKIQEISAAVPAICYNQANPAAEAFLQEVVYDPLDYSNSQIDIYVGLDGNYDKSRPFGVSVDVPEGTLVITDRYSRRSVEKDVLQETVILYNIIPGEQGADYSVVSGNEIKRSGRLIPSGQLRMINCQTSNVRDLGGWLCDGGKVKYGKLFRGGEFNADDVEIFFDQLSIRHELNLRGKTEAEEHYAQETAAGRATMRDFVRVTIPENYVWYTIADTYKAAWRDILRCVFDCAKHNEPLYFHCSAGADRTGTVACIIEAILGVSQSDVDKEYELTNFSSGVDGDSHARRRNESEWSNLIKAITNLPTGSTFRDKVLNWVATLGFTAEDINAFRKSMIDGTPDNITVEVDTYTVTNTLNNASSSNDATTAVQYQTYEADIKPNEGYIIDSVKVMMGGKDVTNTVWDGSETLLRYAITKNLTNCVISSTAGTAINAGYAYTATLVANSGYTMEGSSVSVKMGGVDVTNCYADGEIFIQEVTGDIVITASAASAIPVDPFEFTADNWESSDGLGLAFANGEMQIEAQNVNGVGRRVFCLTRVPRREGTYTMTITANNQQVSNNVNSLFRVFDRNGVELTDKSHWVPNHGYVYNTVYNCFLMNSSYATFTFTLSADVAEFQFGLIPGSLISSGNSVTVNEIELIEP